MKFDKNTVYTTTFSDLRMRYICHDKDVIIMRDEDGVLHSVPKHKWHCICAGITSVRTRVEQFGKVYNPLKGREGKHVFLDTLLKKYRLKFVCTETGEEYNAQ